MSTIGSGYSASGSAWQDLQNWQARMKAANDQFASDTSQYTDSLFGSAVTQSQGLGNLVSQQAVSRLRSSAARQAATGGITVNGPGDVYQGDAANNAYSYASAPVAGSSSDVYWGVDPTSPVVTANPAPSMGSSSDVYWGTPVNMLV